MDARKSRQEELAEDDQAVEPAAQAAETAEHSETGGTPPGQ